MMTNNNWVFERKDYIYDTSTDFKILYNISLSNNKFEKEKNKKTGIV